MVKFDTSKVVFSGCSFTAGDGWEEPGIDCKYSKNLWVNLCAANIESLKTLDVVNVGQSGASNAIIFENTVKAISDYSSSIEIMFCQWTAMPRYQFSVGLETWDTSERFGFRQTYAKKDVYLSDGTRFTREYLDNLLNQINALHHLHGEILKLVKYTNTLKKLAAAFDIKIYFINGLCPWDTDYFDSITKDDVKPEDFTNFTKTSILDIKNKNDSDIFKLYKLIHNDYNREGGIDSSDWINLYDSMHKNKIDTNSDNLHPGINSNKLYFQQIETFLKSR